MKFKLPILIVTIGVFLTLFFGINAQSIPTITLDKPISEMTILELQATIAEILQAIQQLQALLLQLTGEAPSISGIPSTFTFQSNLRYGQYSADVKYLQIFLNIDPVTKVFQTGAGSPGNESMYFGSRTKAAVVAFQTKYKNAISAITGYTIAGTGYVGPGTRTKVNQLLKQYRSGVVPPGGEVVPPGGEEATCGEDDGVCPSGCAHSQDIDCTYCGDRIVQSPNNEGITEVCDTANLNNQTCETRGYAGGTLSCSNTCLTFNVRACLLGGGGSPSSEGGSPALEPEPEPELFCGAADNICPSGCAYSQDTDCTYCGDNIIQSLNNEGIAEVCDGTDLGEETSCQSYFGSGWTGSLFCSSGCLTFNTTSCAPSPPPNEAPVLGLIGNQSVNENQELTFTVSATDPEEDTLTYSIQGLPAGVTFQDQTFTWTPSYAQSETYNLTFIVSDGSLTDEELITITVYNVNRAPVLASIGSKSINENQTLTFQITATDPDNDSLTYSIQGLVSGVTFNSFTQTFAWTPTYEQSGTYNLTFTVSDAELTDSETITITVTDVCAPDTCSGLGYECGSHSDGCGGTISCGTCQTGYTCISGQCIEDAPIPVCGDGTCNGTETCSTCPGDCGACPVGECDYIINTGESINAYSSVVQPGETVCIKAGTYNETLSPQNSGTVGDLITFKAYPGEACEGDYMENKNNCQAVLDGQGNSESGVNLNGLRYIRIEGFEIKNWMRDAIFISNPTITPILKGHEIVNNYIHEIGNVGTGSTFDNTAAIVARGSQGVLIENNEMYRISGYGIRSRNAIDLVVRGNTIHYVGKDGIRTGTQSHATGSNIIVEFNRLYDSIHTIAHQDALEFIGSHDGTTIRYNIIYDWTQNVYISTDSGEGATIRNVAIYGNVFYTDKYYTDQGNLTTAIFIDGRWNRHSLQENIMIHSNTFGWTGYAPIWIYMDDGSNINGITMRNNIFYEGGYAVTPGATNINSDYNLFYNVTSDERSYEGIYSIIDDPNFVNYQRHSSWDFHLQETSPAIDAGDFVLNTIFNLPDSFVDIDGNGRPQGSDYDIGSYEYVSGTSECADIDTSCGIWPNCQNCNTQDGCVGTTHRDYYCISNSSGCDYTEDDCSDCSCSCRGYNVTESIADDNCNDGIDNDCDGQTDSNDSGCQECTPGQTQSCDTGLQGICVEGTQTCQSDGTWGNCVQDNQPTIELCTDSLDNDCDNEIDCNDSDCLTDPACEVAGIPNDYVSYWKFENNANDETGNNNGTINGNPQFVSGVQGQALSFDGDGDYINVLKDDFNYSNVSLGVWVYSTSDVEGHSVHIGNSGTVEWFSISHVGGNFHTAIDDNENRGGCGKIIYSTVGESYNNAWHYVVATVSVGDRLRLYIDGVEYGSGASLAGCVLEYAYTYGYTIGSERELTNEFNGTIDEVMIYNRALSESEIQQIYNSQKPGALPARISQTDEKLNNLASVLSSIQSAVQDIIRRMQTIFNF